tara:strand:+ start:188 stop:436 length:249 start_codon:yes stop_codon:yes gene_type:complete
MPETRVEIMELPGGDRLIVEEGILKVCVEDGPDRPVTHCIEITGPHSAYIIVLHSSFLDEMVQAVEDALGDDHTIRVEKLSE